MRKRIREQARKDGCVCVCVCEREREREREREVQRYSIYACFLVVFYNASIAVCQAV